MSEFNITNLPTEILEKIFSHFDDTTNAIAIGVCRRFNEVLSETIRRKYNGSNKNKWYEIEIFDSTLESQEIQQHRPCILSRVSAINLTFHVGLDNQNHWIHRVINQIGRNIRMIRLRTPNIDAELQVNFHKILSRTPNISHLYVDYVYPTNKKWCYRRYKELTHLEMNLRTFYHQNELKPFAKKNYQLKNVILEIFDFKLFYAFDQTKIESLHCMYTHASCRDIPVDIQPVKLTHLKKLNLEVPKNSFDECVEKIVAPCQNLQDLRLIHFEEFALTDKTVELLCSLRSLETFEPCFYMSMENCVRFINNMPTLITISLWYKAFNLSDYQMLVEAANKHQSLRYIQLHDDKKDIYNHSVLNWLMRNVNSRIEINHSICYKLVVTKGKVQYDGVTIMSSNEVEHGKAIDEQWFERLKFMTSMRNEYFEFFSNLPMLRHLFDESTNIHLQLDDDTNESFVKRVGANIKYASTTFSSSYDKSVNRMNWLEKHCNGLQTLYLSIKTDHSELPNWTFPELDVLRVNYDRKNDSLNLSLFESFNCPRLLCLKFVGWRPISLANIDAVHDIVLFDNLVKLEIFHFNDSMNNLLEKFNQNVQHNLEYLTLANRRIDFSRYKMNNKTITAIAMFPNLRKLKLILAGLNETNTKFLFENCKKLSELYFECNFLSDDRLFVRSSTSNIFDHIKSNCIALRRLQLVWYDKMMDPDRVTAVHVKDRFPDVFVKIMQVDEHLCTKAEQIIHKTNFVLERLFDEYEV